MRVVSCGLLPIVCRPRHGSGHYRDPAAARALVLGFRVPLGRPDWQNPRGRVPHFFFPDAPETPFVICLMHSDSLFLPGTTKCRFLIECPPDEAHPLGQARCGIYGVRPSACRVFPTKLNADG